MGSKQHFEGRVGVFMINDWRQGEKHLRRGAEVEEEEEGDRTRMSRHCSHWYGRTGSELRSTVIPPVLSSLASERCGGDWAPPPLPPSEQLLSDAAIVSMLGAVIGGGRCHNQYKGRERERERGAVNRRNRLRWDGEENEMEAELGMPVLTRSSPEKIP